MNAAIARIVLRYLAGILVAIGWLAPDLGAQLAIDPDVLGLVANLVGLTIMVITEGWYWLAKRFGWST